MTKISLNHCLNFLKSAVSLKNIEQVSSLDSMHVIMGIVNKLPINLK